MKKYGAVLIETRVIENLSEIIFDHHMKFLPKDWELTLYLSNANKHLIDHSKFDGRNVRIRILHNPVVSSGDYNRLLTLVSFWNSIYDYEKVLIFQTDSRILRKGIEAFLEFDFIGAPHFSAFPMMNGGLSIRDPKKCFEICHKIPYDGQRNEDWRFCVFMPEVGGKIPTIDAAKAFSVETVYALGSFGIHAIDKWLTKEQCEEILNQYPQ